MNKLFRRTLKILAALMILFFCAAGLFIYKAKYGINFYEKVPPRIESELNGHTVLLFSKTNGFRHGAAIEASIPAFQQMADGNGWTLVITDNGAVFNPDQLEKIDVVIWNNTSGKVLNVEQRQAFKSFLLEGGGFVGIHAAGDDSHQWDWYEDTVIDTIGILCIKS